MKTQRLQLRIDPELKRQVERLAKKQNRSLSCLMTELLKAVVEQERTASKDDNGVKQI